MYRALWNRGHGLSPAAPRVRLPPGTHFGVHVSRMGDLEERILVGGRFQHPGWVPVAVNRPHIAAVAATMGEVRVPEEQRWYLVTSGGVRADLLAEFTHISAEH